MKEGEVRVRACGRVGQRHVKVVDEHRETTRVCKKRRSAIFSLFSPFSPPVFSRLQLFYPGAGDWHWAIRLGLEQETQSREQAERGRQSERPQRWRGREIAHEIAGNDKTAHRIERVSEIELLWGEAFVREALQHTAKPPSALPRSTYSSLFHSALSPRSIFCRLILSHSERVFACSRKNPDKSMKYRLGWERTAE